MGGVRGAPGVKGTPVTTSALSARLAAALFCLATVAACSSSASSSGPTSRSASASSSPAPTAPSSAASASSPAAPASTTAPPVSSSSASPGVAACATSSLRVTQGPPQGYAGGVYEAIDFTNISDPSCTLYGYPGVSLVSAPPYTQIGLSAERSTTTPVKLITLASGATANAMLQIVDALNYPTSTCSPVKAAYLRVFPPNQTVPVYLANSSEACAKPVHILFINAVQAGSGGSS
jgi:Protein of unknown function (DUF4232)